MYYSKQISPTRTNKVDKENQTAEGAHKRLRGHNTRGKHNKTVCKIVSINYNMAMVNNFFVIDLTIIIVSSRYRPYLGNPTNI